MSLTFPSINNQATIPITTANSNILVTLTSPATITTTAICSASSMVIANPAPVISVASTGQDAKLETRLNAMENAIFKLRSTFEKFISTNNPPGRSREKKKIEDIWLISQSMLPNLKLISPLMKSVTVAHLLKRNPAEILWMLISAEHQRMYLIKTLITGSRCRKAGSVR